MKLYFLIAGAFVAYICYEFPGFKTHVAVGVSAFVLIAIAQAIAEKVEEYFNRKIKERKT